jgi:transcription-repair coupling factor (superfamily II helicase)
LESFNRLAQAVEAGKTPALATGVLDSQKIHLLWALAHKFGKIPVVVCSSELDAKEVYQDLRFFYKDKVFHFPSKDIVFYSADVKSGDILKSRLNCINALLHGSAQAVVLTVETLFDRLTAKEIFSEHIIKISTRDELKLDVLTRQLVNMGYTNTASEISGAGQFAVRGGILDIFTPIGFEAYRVEFWGDTVDSIRILDTSSQRSVNNVNEITVFPAKELVYNDETRDSAVKKLSAAYEKYSKTLKSKNLFEEAANLAHGVGEDLRLLTEGETVSGLDRYAQFFYGGEITLLDYFPPDTIIYFNEPSRIKSHSETVFTEFSQSIENRIQKGYMLPQQMNMVFSYAQILHLAGKFPCVLFSSVAQNVPDFTLKEIISFTVKSVGSFNGNLAFLYSDIKFMLMNSHAVLFLSGQKSKAERFVCELLDEGINAVFVPDLNGYKINPGTVAVSTGALRRGFTYQYINFTVITDLEVFGAEKKRYAKKPKKAAKIESFLDLKTGDYVVHRSHGIGVYRGIEKIITENISRDYMRLSYSDGGTLFVPVNSMDAVQKYIGGSDASPKLNKLGGAEWHKAKSRTQKAVKILAEELIQLYAKRQKQQGYMFSPDTVWQAEFEDGFEFDETDDQLQSIEEVKADMESGKVMDRLLCGDVGYGKTEVAIRAAFKAVQDNKQVAYLVPTTILAQQHYNTFTQRMKDFPVTVELLSRFRTKGQQQESLLKLSKGLSDIVIGTHRLLSKDVEFKDLGLVIVDEEQRFGVGQKEKLKRLTENVDVLTLSATPIPRTLHMSLTNLRDMSVLEEPPLERHPVQTYVLEYNIDFVRDAIHRELARGGQVYYLFNRVRSIEEQANKISQLVPDASVAYAHGQMSERALENIMKDFIDRRIDVLVCTTIIETGLDIGNVNTIIINDADRMGLAQLYQLRGRVGRSNKIAYAYLMYKKDKVLDEVAEKRLQAIREFTEFGSGFKIAMRDLEIRGAGNLLGAEQHGHMDSVGYELYCRLLDEAVAEISGDTKAKGFETSIDIKVNAFIPDFYIQNEEAKLEIYKKIAAIENEIDLADVTDELTDRFGDIPKSVLTLLDIATLKAKAHNMGISQISQKNQAVIVTFEESALGENFDIAGFLNKYKGKVFFTAHSHSPYITYKPEEGESITPLWIKEFITHLLAN